MNSTLKYLLILLLVPVVIFAATLILSNVPSQSQTGGGTGDDDGTGITGDPLEFAASEISYAPESDYLPARYFPGYFEVSDRIMPVSFWFKNRHPVPVRVTVLGRGCTSCTHARMGVLPDAEVQQFLTRAAVDAVPGGVFGPPNLLAGLSAVLLMDSAKWHDFDFDRPDDSATTVPAGAAPGHPTWGVFQMGIKVGSLGPRENLNATLGMRAGSSPEKNLTFKVIIYGVPPFAVSPESINLGTLPEGTPDRTATVYYWSATRHADTLPPPTLSYSSSDRFFTVGQPELVPAAEMPAIASTLLGEAKGIPVLTAYRFPVSIRRHHGDSEPDIGPFNRTIGIACPGTTHAFSLHVSATITGLVNLREGGKIDLGSFDARFGAEKAVELVSQRPGLELTVADKEHTPSYVVVTLSPPRDDGNARRWTLKVGIPGNLVLGDLPTDSYVVLTAKTDTGLQRVRIPIVGRGISR